jgi:hypothetical protein
MPRETMPRRETAIRTAEVLPCRRTANARFDAYLMIDWSASAIPKTGADSIWWALLEWESEATGDSRRSNAPAHLVTGNCATRAELMAWVQAELTDRLRDRRILVGFDFPFGFPRGFAAALGCCGSPSDAWREVWCVLARAIEDGSDNANNRFAVAAAVNEQVSGSYGPFYGRPARVPVEVARTLSERQAGYFEYPLRTRRGNALAARRYADLRARTRSSPWFVYGGGNSVGGQALVGIPRVLAFRDGMADARIWPFETGPVLPPAAGGRVIIAEIYPSLFHVRDRLSPQVHDKLQVEAAARRFATLDAGGALERMLAAPATDPAVLHEEGWILGVG